MRPRMALGNQKTFAEHGTQHADARRGARIILVIAEQNVPDRIRLVQDKTVAEEEAALDDVFLISALSPGRDHVPLDHRKPAEERHIVRRTRRGRRDDGPTHAGDIHGSLPRR
ncbi:hypothetical protein ACVWZZ_004209 [Bradyrhizobium sp. LM6.10]